jgi:hypothetical protein
MNYSVMESFERILFRFYFSLKKNTGSLQAQYRINPHTIKEGRSSDNCIKCNFFAPEKSSDSNYDARSGSAPAARASPDCDCVVSRVHNRGEIFRSGNAGTSQCAPAPHGGHGWRKGADHTGKEDFSRAIFFKNHH